MSSKIGLVQVLRKFKSLLLYCFFFSHRKGLNLKKNENLTFYHKLYFEYYHEGSNNQLSLEW